MAVAAGTISLVSKTAVQAVLSCTAASGGTGPYTYQWYRSTTAGFTPGGGNILAGKTTLSLTDTGLVPGTQYYYSLVATDTGDSNVTDEATQLGVMTDLQNQNQNQFSQSVIVGMVDLRLNANTIAVQIDVSETGTLYPGDLVKIVDSADGIPKVIKITATTDNVLGAINYNIKNAAFVAGMAAEISLAGNVIYLMATAAVARGVQVVPVLATVGGVAAASGSGGENIIGWSIDKAAAAGTAIRVMMTSPSFAFDA